ncbi:MAG TPA: tyrosine-type recombinase/integrase [Bradyrhizobium sp.]|jgi:integrase/recombinase XerD|nr:tyrosine-type recombinase/integrase [Bradyrhizobium sp.]
MFEQLFSSESACRRHRDAPLADERQRYLQHCAEQGATHGTLRMKAKELLWLARHLGSDASVGVDMEDLQGIVRRRQSACRGTTTVRRLIDIARPWLKFLGWWRAPVVEFQFQHQLDQYAAWMRDERGLSRQTVERWHAHAKAFLQWCEKTNQRLTTLRPSDIDCYFVDEGAQRRWSRVSISHTATALRAFLRYAAMLGMCDTRLAVTVRRPTVYRHESLPRGPEWPDVRRILTKTDTDEPRDIRNRAILMLLAIYGMRSGEVASLRLDQIDWRARALQLFRLKRRQAQVYPLLPSVAEALARYIDTVRPPVPYPEVFIRLQAPWRPIKSSSLYDVANREFVALGIQTARHGPHAFRHACAAQLLANGLTFKEIGDHLGHRSTSATATYAKVDIISLREVGDFDLGELQCC